MCKRLPYIHMTYVCVESFQQHNVRGRGYFKILPMQ